MEKRKNETLTAFTMRRLVAEIISQELEELASNFEEAGLDAPWRGQEVADLIRDRIKNHPALS